MKHTSCPNCNSDQPLRDCWVWASLQQRCNNCGWRGEPRTPEQLAIRDTQIVNVSRFGGYEYTAYDKYGHVVVYSQSYKTREEADKAIASELERSKKDKERGPYTVVLWPTTVVVKGEVFKIEGEST